VSAEAWLSQPGTALKVGVLVATATAAGLVAAVIFTALTFSGQASPHLNILAVPAFAVVILGLIWAIFIAYSRGLGRGGPSARSGVANAWAWFHRGLSTAYLCGLLAVFALGVIATITSISGLSHGNPEPARRGCHWPLQNHVIVTCVSHAQYEEAQAASQRLVVGGLVSSFAVEFAFALAELAGRRTSLLTEGSDG
jgi:hypothetical protein